MSVDFSILNSKILLVDDEPTNTELLVEMLTFKGYHNVHVINDSRNVKLFCQTHEVDLIILDYKMPYLNGIDIMKQLRNRKYKFDIPIIMLTAQLGTNSHKFILREAANDVIVKPFNSYYLLHRVRTLLEIHLYQKYTYMEA